MKSWEFVGTMSFSIICALVSIIICLGYLYIKWSFGYWQRNKIPFVRKRNRDHVALMFASLYWNQKNKDENSPVLGFYTFHRPVLLAVKLDMVRNIFIKDFQVFCDRGLYYDEKDDPLSAHLFNVGYEKWKPLRGKLSTTFTSGKMKFMFPTVVSVADSFVECLNEAVKIDSEVEIGEWLGRFTTDIIGTCAFGIECNSLKDPDAKFREMGKRIFMGPKWNRLKLLLYRKFKRLTQTLGVLHHHEEVTEFFLNSVKETVEYRERNNIQRNDFMSLLIDLKNSENESDRLTINEIAAEAFAFFLAGFETSSTAMTFCLYELVLDKNRHIQDEARREIAMVLEKHNGQLTYEALNEMQFIGQILNETLRKYPPAGMVPRRASTDYKLPGTNYVIPKGMMIIVPIYGIHHDPEYYENPDEFDPSRFKPERAKLRPSCTFLPFGEGPRNCIGWRFGMMQMKIGLVKLLQNFEFSICQRTPIQMKFDLERLFLTPEDGMWLSIKSLKSH